MTNEELERMAHQTHNVVDGYMQMATGLMTIERAQFVRQLRVGQGYSYRAVAHDCRTPFGGTWLPLSNQLAGVALCAVAAKLLGEDPGDENWN